MYSRVTLLEIDTMRVTIEEAAAVFEDQVLPRLREEEGYEGVVAMATPEGQGMIVTFWETEEQARDASGFASTELERFVTLFRSPPGREVYEISVSDLAEVRV